jgi:preprotein translocase subunit SecD
VIKRSLVVSLVGIIVLAILSFGGTLIAGNSPQLGLDLQGGASVVLEPNRPVSSGILNQAISIIRSRVDALGVAEPDISRQGSSIVVQLPGVKDQEKALEVVGQTAELRFRPVLAQLPPESAATTTTSSTTTTTAAEGESATTTTTAGGDPATTTTTAVPGTTSREEDKPNQQVVLPELDDDGNAVSRYQLGPALATGEIIKTANAAFNQDASEWQVDFQTTGSGSSKFDEIAGKCSPPDPSICPTGRLAVVLDSVVITAPTIQTASFGGRGQITGDFSQGEAKDLALVLRYGALPVQLEPQTVQRVSATLGKDSLNAGILAGLAGLALVLLYIIIYYRALGVVVVVGLAVSAALLWSVIAFLGETSGLALSLAGATGIIVSVGVTVDSYVVYFERLKDEIKSGRSIRSSVDRGFSRAYRTIIAADVSSLIGAGLLYFLTVGPVRGFAFFLGLSTLLDLVVAYFFTRPAVALLSRSKTFTEAKRLGVARGLAARPAGES